MTHYTTWGPVRKSCGHKHTSFDSAAKCALRDENVCCRASKAGGYSDRTAYPLDALLINATGEAYGIDRAKLT